jgi:hypothetical protein
MDHVGMETVPSRWIEQEPDPICPQGPLRLCMGEGLKWGQVPTFQGWSRSLGQKQSSPLAEVDE